MLVYFGNMNVLDMSLVSIASVIHCCISKVCMFFVKVKYLSEEHLDISV